VERQSAPYPTTSVGRVLISIPYAVQARINHGTRGQCDARPTVTFPAAGHHRSLTGTKLYCSVTEAHACEQLAQGCCLKAQGRTPWTVLNFRAFPKRRCHDCDFLPRTQLDAWLSPVVTDSVCGSLLPIAHLPAKLARWGRTCQCFYGNDKTQMRVIAAPHSRSSVVTPKKNDNENKNNVAKYSYSRFRRALKLYRTELFC